MDELTIIAENLADADRLLWDSLVLRSAHLAELASYLKKRLTDGEEAEQLLTSLYGEFSELLKARETSSESKELPRMMSLITKTELCRSLAKLERGKEIPTWSASQPVIAYFPNPYAGRVLQCINDALGGVDTFAAEDYSDACEGVSDGRFDFCVLPVESARDGVMNRFVQMIDRYDLFTVLTCQLELAEEEFIRFAVLSATPWRLSSADHLQVKVVTGEETLWELLFAADRLGASLEGCRPVPGDGERTYQLTFQVEHTDVAALTYYLDMGWSRSTFTGFYKQYTLPMQPGNELLY